MENTFKYPNQRLSDKEKMKNDFEWAKRMIDYLIQVSNPYTGNGTNDEEYHEMLSNYQLYNNILNQKDFERECNPLGLNIGEFADEIKPYNKSYNIVQVLLGEEIKRYLDFKTVVTDSESIRTKFIEQDIALEEFATKTIYEINLIVQEFINKSNPQDPEKQLTEEENQALQEEMNQKVDALINKMFSEEMLEDLKSTNYITKKELASSKVLKYLNTKLQLPNLKNDNFKHALLAGKELSWVGIRNGEPIVENVNPLSFWDIKPSETKYYQDGLAAGRSILMTYGDVMNTFGEMLDEEDIKDFEGYLMGYNEGGSHAMMKYPKESLVSNTFRQVHSHRSYHGQYGKSSALTDNEVEVHHVEWKSLRKVYFKKFINEYGDEQLDILNEDFVIPSYAIKTFKINEYGKKKSIWQVGDEYSLEEFWIDDVWEGYKIGNVYAGIRRKPYQFRSLDNPFKTKLGYHGVAYSNTNAPNISLMSRLKPFLYLYFIVAHKLKTFIAQDRPPLIHFDVSMVDPKVGLEKTLYYMDQLNINFFNPLENAEQAGSSQRGHVSSPTDRSTMQHISNYINVLQAIDQEIADVAGVSKQRQGMSSPVETATAHQQSIVQSSHITEIYFDIHDKHWENVLNSLVQLAQECWKNKSIIKQYILDDLSVHTLEVTPDMLSNSDIGVFISNSKKANEVFNKISTLAEYALNSQQAKLSDIIRMYKETSITGMVKVFDESEKKMMKLAQEQNEQAQQAVEAQKQADIELLNLEHQHKLELEQLKIEGKLKEKEMDVFKFQQDLDVNGNQIPDHLEVEKLKFEREYAAKEFEFKEKELAAKTDLETKKLNKPTTNK